MTGWRLRRWSRDDEGAVLIMALAVVTVVAVVTGLVLTRGDGSLRATVALRNVAATSYAADGAAQVVLNGLRTGYWDTSDDEIGTVVPDGWAFKNDVGDGCFGKNFQDATPEDDDITTEDSDLVLGDLYPAAKASGDGPTSAYVTCEPEEATGIQGTVRVVTSANSPGDAIITLGTGGENGIYNFNKVLKVRGGVRANSNINANKAIQVNDANVWSRTGSCTNVTISVGYQCGTNGGVDVSQFDGTRYDADISTIPAWRPVPACAGSYVTFDPGYYDNAAALEALNSCNKILWFKPGTYYFDFHNSSTNGDPLYASSIVGSSDDEWLIEGRKVVAGALKAGVDLATNPALPGVCQNPIDDVTAQGVQFILGGDSRINFGKDTVAELCATYRSNRPPMVLYGARTGDSDFPGNPSLTALKGATGALTTSGTPTVTTGSDPATFTPITAAALTDEGNGIATWTRGAASGTNGNESRTITMGGFKPPTDITKGAVLTSARLLVRQRTATATGATPASRIVITPSAPGSGVLAPITLAKQAALPASPETFDLTSVLAPIMHDNGFSGASIAFTASANRGQTAQLDYVRLELEFYVPQLRGPSAIATNCVTTIGGSGCYQLDTHKKSEVYLQGTTFLPKGRINLEVANTDYQVFRWGVIARSLNADVNGAYKSDGALIELPDKSPGLGLDGTLVQFTVYVCPDSATCDDTGTLALKVRAQVWDVDGDPETIDDREVTVLSWSHQR